MSCLLGCLLRCVEEDRQHCNGKDDADGVCNGSVVSDQLAVCVSIDHLAQALRCQHEVGAGHWLETLRAAKAAGAKIILLTHYEDSPGAKLADIVLLCGAQESPLDSGNIPVKVALLYVAEVLVLRYTMDDPENANAAQDRTSEALAVKML